MHNPSASVSEKPLMYQEMNQKTTLRLFSILALEIKTRQPSPRPPQAPQHHTLQQQSTVAERETLAGARLWARGDQPFLPLALGQAVAMGKRRVSPILAILNWNLAEKNKAKQLATAKNLPITKTLPYAIGDRLHPLPPSTLLLFIPFTKVFFCLFGLFCFY